MSSPAIGIDLGTRNALAAFLDEDGAVRLIPNRWGTTTTHSVVGWEDGAWVVGEDAVRLGLRGGSVWWDLKRKVGTSFRAFPDGRPRTAQDLLVPLLEALREDAEVCLKSFVSSCVLTVPACFTLPQREAMIRAANAAGLNARIVSEPTAAALAFGRQGRFLVLDFGAGTTDISAVESEGGVWQVLESVGTDTVGGYEFDVALAEWLRESLLLDKFDAGDVRWQMLLQEAERIKIALSDCWSIHWTPPALGGWAPPELTIYREDMERLMRFSIRRLIHTVRRLWDRYEPEHLLLVGGSSRIPLLQEILEREVALPERLSLCAEDAVARGAALYTASGRERLLLDALSGDLNALWCGQTLTLIPSESVLPAHAEVTLEAERSGHATLEIHQSRNELRDESVRLGSLDLEVEAGEQLRLACLLSASGRFTASLTRGTEECVPIPLVLEGAEADRSAEAENDRRLRELKLSLVSLETLLSGSQRARLHLLFRRAEGAPSDPEVMGLLEGLVKDLKRAVS